MKQILNKLLMSVLCALVLSINAFSVYAEDTIPTEETSDVETANNAKETHKSEEIIKNSDITSNKQEIENSNEPLNDFDENIETISENITATTWQDEWNYELKTDDKNRDWIIIKTYWGGSETNYTIPAKAVINGKTYNTALSVITNTNTLNLGTIENLSFEQGVHIGQGQTLFMNCKTLKTIDFTGIETSEMDNMYEMFRECDSLENINFPKEFDTSNVTSSGEIFYKCGSLKSLDLSNWDFTNFYTLEYFVTWDGSLTSITFPENINTENIHSLEYAFTGTSLKSLDLSGFKTPKLTNLNYTFKWCGSLEELDVSNFDTSNVIWMENTFHSCYSLKSLDLSSWDTSKVTTSMESLFYNCSSLTSLLIPKFNTPNVTNMSYMFYKCSSLTELNVSALNTSNVTTMAGMFEECSSLGTLNLSNFNTSKVTNMNNMFGNCKSLASIDVNSFDTSSVENFQGLFYECNSLVDVDVSNFNTSNATNMQGIFEGCKSLTSLNLLNWNTTNVTNMQSLFAECTSLTKLDLRSFITTSVTNMSRMFYNDSELSLILVGNDWNTELVDNSENMFYNCTNLINFSSSKIDKTMAYAGYPGYLTQYTIIYNKNGGLLTETYYDRYLKQNAALAVVQKIQYSFLKNPGHIFKGWNTEKDGSGINFVPQQEVIGLCENIGDEITLYAQWEPYNVDIIIPSKIGIYIDSEGNATVLDNWNIINNSNIPVNLTDIEIKGQNGWSLTNETPETINSKELNITINNIASENNKYSFTSKWIKVGEEINLPLSITSSLYTKKYDEIAYKMTVNFSYGDNVYNASS